MKLSFTAVCQSVHSSMRRKFVMTSRTFPHDLLAYIWIFALIVQVVEGERTQQVLQETFTAAVYEHRVFNARDPAEVVTVAEANAWSNRNLRIYKEQTRIAANRGADIIVFPESGIYGYDKTRDSIKPYLEEISIPEESSNQSFVPCRDIKHSHSSSVLKSLSCIAKDHHIYLVANMAEKLVCNQTTDVKCPKDGQFQFDTNVIFNKRGKLVAKYRKKHLYWQPMFDTPSQAEIVVIRTPFGTLGTFVAGDIFYKSPALDLVEKHNVDTVVMTTTWDNTFPYPRAVAVQEGYALRMRVNLLASNTHAAKYKISGSGIYSTTGAVLYHYNTSSDEGKLLIGTLPVKPRSISQTPLPPWIEDNSEVTVKTFKAKISGNTVECMPLKHLEGRVKVCQRDFCCFLSYSFTRRSEMELFVFGVFNGVHSELISMYTQTCAVFKCAGMKHKTCGVAPSSSLSIIGEFRMSGSFSDGVYVFPYVTTSGPNGTSLSASDFYFSDDVIHSVHGLRHPLLSAILFGRYYSRDTNTPPYETIPPTKNTNGATVFVTASTSAFLLACIFTFRIATMK